MNLEDLRMRLNQYRLILKSKNRVPETSIRIFVQTNDEELKSVVSTDLLTIDGKYNIVLKIKEAK